MGAKEINAPAAQDALAETKEDADVCQLRLLTTHPMKLSDDVCSSQLRPSRNKLWASVFFLFDKKSFFPWRPLALVVQFPPFQVAALLFQTRRKPPVAFKSINSVQDEGS